MPNTVCRVVASAWRRPLWGDVFIEGSAFGACHLANTSATTIPKDRNKKYIVILMIFVPFYFITS